MQSFSRTFETQAQPPSSSVDGHAQIGRPRGELGAAILSAAKAGPGTVKELADRACVGRRVACYTCSRLVASGHLVVLHKRPPFDGPGRPPEVLALPSKDIAEPADALAAVMSAWR